VARLGTTTKGSTMDPFLLITRVAQSDNPRAELRSVAGADLGTSADEILRLVAAGDAFGAGLVLALALGTPLIAPDALALAG
jgi:hypothetical protein